MNELIKKLAVQADMWCEQNVSLHAGTPLYNTIWEEKFSELIIRECAGQVSRTSEAISILEHFGLKE